MLKQWRETPCHGKPHARPADRRRNDGTIVTGQGTIDKSRAG
jgi:hypothetical protein